MLTYQRTCVGSSVHKTVSSHVHHLHGSGAPAFFERPHGQEQHAATAQRSPDKQHDRAGELGSMNSASTPAHTAGRRTAATACITATATATAAAAKVSHKKESQDREVRRQLISELNRRHQSCSRNRTSQHRGSVEMGRTTTRQRSRRSSFNKCTWCTPRENCGPSSKESGATVSKRGEH